MTNTTPMIAVIPTLRQEPARLQNLMRRLEESGITPRLVVTGRRLHESLNQARIPHITPYDNPGFAASVHFGADQGPWDWLFLVNDDITIQDGFVEAVTEIQGNDPRDAHLVFIDNECRRPLPSLGSVFTSVSLLDALLGRLGQERLLERGTDENWYKSFSCVAISHGLWDALDGLDTSFPYTYEDADFTRRARAMGAGIHEVSTTVVSHEGSGTSRRFIGRVLPVGVYSGRRYLVSLGHSRGTATVVIGTALALRVALAPLANAAVRDHVKGITASLSGLGRRHAPRLPNFEEN